MGNFRELIGRDLNSTLESDHHEMPVDRLGAFSKGSRLGTLLWRVKFAKDGACMKPATLLLAKETSMQSEIGQRVCELAISEWILPECDTCKGAKEVIFGPKRIVCPTCDGYGVRRYSDKERGAFLGSRFRPWTRKYANILAVLTAHAGGVNRAMNTELER